MIGSVLVRTASAADLEAVRRIYNEGIEDGVATLEVDPKNSEDIAAWWAEHQERFPVLVATDGAAVVGWAFLNRFSHRCAHAAIADLSVYVARSHRGRGIGHALLGALEQHARRHGFRKIVLHALNGNEHGKRVYRKCGIMEVGVFREHGVLDGEFVDVVAMEKLLG